MIRSVRKVIIIDKTNLIEFTHYPAMIFTDDGIIVNHLTLSPLFEF